MDKVRTTNDGLYLAGIMLDFINSYDKKLSYINLEEFSDELPAMVMQQLTSAVIEKQYIRKDCYIGNWAFAVYIRIRNADTRDRIDAGGCLSDLAEWFRTTELPDLSSINKNAISIEMTASPHKSAIYEDKTEEWQVVFMLRYKNYGG
jgi:hypothetical protein